MIANELKLLPLSHPSQHYFHMPFACQSSQPNFLPRQFIKHHTIKTKQPIKAIKAKKNQDNPLMVRIEGITWTFSQVSAIVRGPCSFTMSKIALVIVWVCSGGVLSSIGFIFGLGFVEKYLIAALNMISFSKFTTLRWAAHWPSSLREWRLFILYPSRNSSVF